jgi:hypothetical protein
MRYSPGTVKLEKLSLEDAPSSVRTVYRVLWKGLDLGYVWSRRGFSYRGAQGWNAGVRLRDFRPIEWRYGVDLLMGGAYCSSRRVGIARLIEARLALAAAIGATPEDLSSQIQAHRPVTAL